MNTPICDFVREYARMNAARFHMPGHKGVGEAEIFDITEIDGADELFHPEGIIQESEACAGEIFGAHTLYSAGGSTLCIQTMLCLTAQYAAGQGKRPRILAGRNAHRAFVNAAALLDIDIRWLRSETAYHSCAVTGQQAARELDRGDFTAVYLTSPDYLGEMVDVRDIARVCRERGVLLLVDNAHGAYLKFLPRSLHPMDLGADMCCDSAHKTLPVLTGGAYLHINKNAPAILHDGGKDAMSVFASSSPSYLILRSLDAFNGMAGEYVREIKSFLPEVQGLKDRLKQQGFETAGSEPMKITIKPKSYGYTGEDAARILESAGVYPEFYDRDHLVLMMTPRNKKGELERVESAFIGMARRSAITEMPPVAPVLENVMTPRQAMLSGSEELPVEQCRGRVLAGANVSCPPAIPVAVCGERIDEAAIAAMKYYGTAACRVVKEK